MRILVIDDHAIIIAGLQILLKELFLNCKIDEANYGDKAKLLFESNDYDLVIMDLNLPETDSLKLLKYFTTYKPQVKVLIFSMKKEDVYALGVIRLGAKGYVSKESGYTELKDAITKIVNNGIYVSDHLLTKVLHSNNGNKHHNDNIVTNPMSTLTKRELEIIELLAIGHGTKEIANLTGLKTNTISTFKHKIFSKLNVSNTIELIEVLNLNKTL